MKHTKGKWTVSINPLETTNNDDAGTIWRDTKDGSTLIATTSKSPGLKEGQANAYLISLAPKMYKALQTIEENFPKDVIEDQCGEDAEIILDAIQAIKTI